MAINEQNGKVSVLSFGSISKEVNTLIAFLSFTMYYKLKAINSV